MSLSGRHRNLIIGMPGSGKTTLVEHMQARGHFALDGDLIEGLGVWRNADGEQVVYQPDREWRASHLFSWDTGRLTDVIFDRLSNESRPIYLFGTAPRIEDHSFWFHNALALYASAATIYERLRHPERKTPYPFQMEQSDFPLLERAVNRYQFLATYCLGYTAIDAERPVADIADDIVLQCEIPHSSPKQPPPISIMRLLSALDLQSEL